MRYEVRGELGFLAEVARRFSLDSGVCVCVPKADSPSSWTFKVFEKTILVVNEQFELFWAVHSASEK